VENAVAEIADYWNAVYARGETTRSWYQAHADHSLALLERCGVTPDDSLIDVGGGASTLVDDLLDRGYRDLTVLDISTTGVQAARQRLGRAAQRVHWMVADLLSWQPQRTYRVWHDRAVLHFLTKDQARQQYLAALNAATTTGAVAVIATFAPDGPEQCSGLPVTRYGPDDLAELLDPGWSPIADDRVEHTTPAGAIQPFSWAAFRRL
jgi:trans-aconitate methyltransferase